MQNIISLIKKIFNKGTSPKNNNIPQDKSLRFEYIQTHFTTNAILLSCSLVTFVFAMAFDRNNIACFIIECSIAAILLISFLMRRFWGGGNNLLYDMYGKLIPVIAFCILVTMLYYRGSEDNLIGIWIVGTPIISIFILGKRIGIIISAITMLWIFAVGFIPENEWHNGYTTASTIRYMGTYFLIALFTYIYEHIRSRHHKHIFKMYNNLKKENSDLERLGLLDKLTEINNLRSFEILSDRAWRLAVNENKTLSFLMLDIDNFKSFNNSHGSSTGDAILKNVAMTLENCACRPLDMVVRIDGDKFGALFFDTDIKQAAWIAKKISADIGLHSIKLPDNSTAKITVSIGVASKTPNDNSELKNLIADADANLLKAKGNGRNQITAI